MNLSSLPKFPGRSQASSAWYRGDASPDLDVRGGLLFKVLFLVALLGPFYGLRWAQLLVLPGESAPPETVVGRWEGQEEPHLGLEFTPQGRMILSWDGGVIDEGFYERNEFGDIRLTNPWNFVLAFHATVTKDNLIIAKPHGGTRTLSLGRIDFPPRDGGVLKLKRKE